MQTIYIGNLPFDATEDDVHQLFSQHGEVGKVMLVNDKETGQSRGFGFVEMDPATSGVAIDALDGSDYGGRTLRVNEARDKGAKPPRRQW